MRGIADGAKRDLLDIVALNVRTEINFGLFSDGCTALAWHTGDHAWLGQNWDVSNKQQTTYKNGCNYCVLICTRVSG
jgi:isopenicillin-N N-acyltransferase-like protein